jgi:SPP1 gp7 family putative phage head morphogenesis protein
MAPPRSATAAVADALTEHGVDLLRLSTSSTVKVIEFLRELQDDLERQLRRSGVGRDDARRLRSLLADAKALIARTYREVARMQAADWLDWANVEAQVTASIVNEQLGAKMMEGVLPRSALAVLVRDTLIRGSPAKDWWAKQATTVMQSFAQQVRLGVASGENNAKIIARVGPIMNVPKAQAEALVRTSVQTVANEARLETFRRAADVVKGLRQVSTLDDRTTDICIAYDGAEWDLEGKPMGDTSLPFKGGPPRHWQCRSVLAPVMRTWNELGIDLKENDAPARASRDGPMKPGTSYGDWLRRKSEADQDRILGRARADLWRRGKLSLRELLDQRGNPMTLEQIKRKYRIK